MDIALAVAYFLPICFLALFVGSIGKKFVMYLLWGFLASIPVFFLTPVLISSLPELTTPALTISPVLEEFFKALPLVLPAMMGKRTSHRNVLVYALAAGIGFSIMENWMLFGGESLSFFAVLVRSFSTSLMHGCTAGIIGYGIILIRETHDQAVPSLVLGFFMTAVLIHAFFNFNAMYAGLTGVLLDLLLPVLFFIFLAICYHVDVHRLLAPDERPGPV